MKAPHIDTVLLPKVTTPNDITTISDILSLHPHHANTKILALIESAKGILNLREICTASPRLDGLIFAAEDYSLDVGLERSPSLTEMLYARQSIVTAAVAYNLSSAIDLVCTEYQDPAPLERECRDGAAMGFTGKQLIHPNQIEVAQRMFAPSEERVGWAVRVVVANEKAVKEGRGAWTLEGKMVDAPVVGAAEKVVQKAELAGVDVGALRERYQDVVPE